MWPAASPSAADSGPSATIGPTPGITTATAAARCAASSPNLDAVDESSISEPGDAPPRLCEGALLIMRARNDGHPFAWNAERAEISRRRGGR